LAATSFFISRSAARLSRRLLLTRWYHRRVIEVRPPTTAEMAEVAKLAAKLVRMHHAIDPRRFMIFEPIEPGYERFLTSEMKNGAVVLVGLVGGKVAGYAYGRIEPRDWNALRDECGALHDIYVDETARRSGVARAILTEFLARIGSERVVLMSAWSNVEAQALFEAMGFRRTMVEMTRG
jgi:ribosomal protein S18 acetylase RimI-like enzyme